MPQQQSTKSRFFDTIEGIRQRHDRLKHTVHNGFRYPLPVWGQKVMGVVYFALPIFAGYAATMWAWRKHDEYYGANGERLLEMKKDLPDIIVKNSEKGIVTGNRTVRSDGTEIKVGADGWGKGVRLAVSDEATQKRTQEALDKFLRHQRRLKARDERKRQQQLQEQQEKRAVA